jgi:AcrR family transcriptional regulator
LSSPEPHRSRRARILAAAAACLGELGYDRVRLRDVAQAAGVSVGLIQHYFETRELLLREAFEHVDAEMLGQWARVTRDEPDPWQRLVALVSALADDPDLPRHCVTWTQFCVHAAREPHLRAGVQRVNAAWRRHLEDAIREGVASGRFTLRMPLADVLDLLLAQMDGCELMIVADPAAMDGPRLRALVLRTAALALALGADAELPG